MLVVVLFLFFGLICVVLEDLSIKFIAEIGSIQGVVSGWTGASINYIVLTLTFTCGGAGMVVAGLAGRSANLREKLPDRMDLRLIDWSHRDGGWHSISIILPRETMLFVPPVDDFDCSCFYLQNVFFFICTHIHLESTALSQCVLSSIYFYEHFQLPITILTVLMFVLSSGTVEVVSVHKMVMLSLSRNWNGNSCGMFKVTGKGFKTMRPFQIFIFCLWLNDSTRLARICTWESKKWLYFLFVFVSFFYVL